MIAAIALTLRQRKDTKFVDPSDQVKVRARDRLHVVKVEVTKPPVAPQPVAPAAVEAAATGEKKA
jgi:NADH-quinone oxidoreductase subunit J